MKTDGNVWESILGDATFKVTDIDCIQISIFTSLDDTPLTHSKMLEDEIGFLCG